MPTFDDLFQDAVASAFDKQLAFGEVIGDADWQIIISEGKLVFGGVQSFAIQVIGTESHRDNTWLWGWANDASQLPAAVLRDGEQLRALGQQQEISELTNPLLTLSPALDGHRITTVASMLCQADAYYRCPYDGGALFVTIHQPNYRRQVEYPLLHITTVFPQVISAFAGINHRRALTSYLRFYDVAITETSTVLTGTDARGNTITATFDALGRLSNLATNFKGS